MPVHIAAFSFCFRYTPEPTLTLVRVSTYLSLTTPTHFGDQKHCTTESSTQNKHLGNFGHTIFKIFIFFLGDGVGKQNEKSKVKEIFVKVQWRSE